MLKHIKANIPKFFILNKIAEFGNNAKVVFGINFNTNQKIVIKFIEKTDRL